MEAQIIANLIEYEPEITIKRYAEMKRELMLISIVSNLRDMEKEYELLKTDNDRQIDIRPLLWQSHDVA